jgi:hypothetical protein
MDQPSRKGCMMGRITPLSRTGWHWGPRPFFRATLIGLLLIIPFVSISPVSAETPKSGTISSNKTWNAGNSPYTITGHMTVVFGVTLTIDSGATVNFDSGKSLVIDGRLVARGTSGTESPLRPVPQVARSACVTLRFEQ